jgi:TolA-binding protein
MKIYHLNDNIILTKTIHRCLILSIISFIALNSCMSPRSVRLNSNKINAGKNTQTTKIAEPFAVAETKVSDSNNPKTVNPENDIELVNDKPNTSSFSKIPTLREQMKSLSDDQVLMRQDLSEMKNDISEIKSMLSNSDLSMNKNVSEPSAVAGVKRKIMEQTFIEPDEKVREKNVIYADENVSKSKNNGIKKPSITAKNSSKKTVKSIPAANDDDNALDYTNQGINNPNFKSALDLYNARSYNASIAKLQEIIKSSKNKELVSAANYLAGESYYAMKQYKEAIKHYKSVIKYGNNAKNDDAQIMIAESYIRSGEIPQAKSAFKSLIDNFPNSEFLPRARKMLQQL